MAKYDGAITPSRDAILKIKRVLKDVDAEPYLDNEDKSYNELAETSGWFKLKKFIERKKEALKPRVDFQGLNDDDFFKSFGMRSLVYEIVSGELDAIINRVEQSNEAVKEERTKRKAKRIRKT